MPDLSALVAKVAAEASLLNLALAAVAFAFYRLYVGAEKARDKDREADATARKEMADTLGRMAEPLTAVKLLVEMLAREKMK